MIEDDVLHVWTHRVDYTGGTVAYGYGETEDGEPVAFAGEPRMLHAIAEAIENEREPVLAAVPPWAIIRRPAPPPAA